MTSQITRVSQKAYGLEKTIDSIKSLTIAYGSNCELETQRMLSGDLDTIGSSILKYIMDQTYKIESLLKALIKSLENKRLNPRILGPFLLSTWEKGHNL